jgi:hypothetical protein
MPIIEQDPWRMQYFEGVPCPDEVVIPTDDMLAFQLYPEHNWIYNKLLICKTQGLEHGPHGIIPSEFPVFSKPIYNLKGMGKGSKIIRSPEELEYDCTPGHLWMPFLDGEHVSTDVAVIDGEPVWWRHTIGKPLHEGTFDYWVVLAESRPHIEDYCGEWLRRNLKGYTGLLNFETISGIIMECHLRFSDQWVDLNGPDWVESVIELYTNKRWAFNDDLRNTGYSVVLFAEHGPRYQIIDDGEINELLKRPHISSIQITFHEDKAPETHTMPPGGFRLSIVNCWDLAAGCELREKIASLFGLAQ